MKGFYLLILATMLMFASLMTSCGSGAAVSHASSAKASGASTSSARATSGRVPEANPNGVRVSCIDVGKGDCILVQSGTSSILIDTGFKKTSDKVISYMRKQGVNKLDAIVLTHYDRDHVGGLRAVAQAFDVGAIYLPGYEGADKNYEETMKAVADQKAPAQQVTKELQLALGNARMTVYPSKVDYYAYAKGSEGNDNDVSLVAALTCGKDSYLFAGDLEEEGVDAYLRGNHGRFDVLKMPHHGAKGDNTEALLDDVQPKIALITDAADDPAGKKTLKLLAQHDVDVYRTSADGTIVVDSDGEGNYAVATNVR